MTPAARLPSQPILFHFPMGIWMMGLLFDLARPFLSGRVPALPRAASFCLALGLIAALISFPAGACELRLQRRGTPARRLAGLHLALQSALLASFLASWLLLRVGGGSSARLPVNVLCAVLMALTSWVGARWFAQARLEGTGPARMRRLSRARERGRAA